MPHIVILSASIRIKRNSHRVALYFKRFIEEKGLATVSILDLNDYAFPIFTERLKFMESPDEKVLDYAGKIVAADGVLIVTPEYNGGSPASLKNAIDVLEPEWARKPVSIVTVSSGNFGGMNMITSIQYSLWKLHAWTVPYIFPVAKVETAYDESGKPADKEGTDKRAARFVKELLWCIEAKNRMSDWT